jgi:hypothetical protein
MTFPNTRAHIRFAAAGLASIMLCACSEPVANTGLPEPQMAAGLVLSKQAPAPGDTVEVFTMATSQAATFVGSYTARLTYDPSGMRFLGDMPFEGAALRATNDEAGLLRFAGAAADGFTDGRLAGWRFVVLRAQGARTLKLEITEIHTVTRVDAHAGLLVSPTRVIDQ